MAAGGVVVSTNPEYQQKVADLLASLPEAQRRNIENLTDLLGTEGFPIHKGDYGKFILPAADKDTSTPATSGYGADGKVDTSVSTGGSEIHENNGSINTSPAGPVPSPGNMYNESTASPRSLIGRQGSDEMTGSQIKKMVKDMKLNGYAGYDPIDVANVNGKLIIIDGHHRTEAAAKAGIRDVPIIVHKVTRQEGEALLQEAAEARVRRY